jgi:hypothetical protein
MYTERPETWFWLGWGILPDLEGRETGGENEDGVGQFGIFVVDKEEMALIRKQKAVYNRRSMESAKERSD